MKFFSTPQRRAYAEVFTMLTFKTQLEFHEKDPEYRVPLVRALTEGTDCRSTPTSSRQVNSSFAQTPFDCGITFLAMSLLNKGFVYRDCLS